MWLRTCGHQYNVSPIHLHALLGVGNIKKAVHVCADSPWSGPRLQKVRETLCYTWCWKYVARHPEPNPEATQRRIKKPPRGESRSHPEADQEATQRRIKKPPRGGSRSHPEADQEATQRRIKKPPRRIKSGTERKVADNVSEFGYSVAIFL
jgi:hypothetical protein